MSRPMIALALSLCVGLPSGGCSAWDTWRAGGRPRPTAPADCVCPEVESLEEGHSRAIDLKLLVGDPEAGGFAGRCPDTGCDCPPIHVRRARETPAPARGGLEHLVGVLRHDRAGFFLDEGPSPHADGRP